MHDPDGDWQLSGQGRQSHVVEEHGLPLPQHHRRQQQLIAKIATLQATEEVLSR